MKENSGGYNAACRFLALQFLLFAGAVMGESPMKVNRTVPHVDLPKTTLEFSANPTVEELFRARIFEEPLVPIGSEPSSAENSDLAAALLGYVKRNGSGDFSSLTGFLERHPRSPWGAALHTDLGLEYYATAHYSLALEAWSHAWNAAKEARDAKGKRLGDRAAGELAYMYARLGRMAELEALLKSTESRTFLGAATEKITGAREGLWSMQNRPEIAFRCGPLALHRIMLSASPHAPGSVEILNSASTPKGFSLSQVAELSQKVGLNYQMAFREKDGDFVIPSVVHWKVGHYAALTRREGNLYLLEDPTFRNNVWATKQALEAETSGYFLIPPGPLPREWRSVPLTEGGGIWGKGNVGNNDPDTITPDDPRSRNEPCKGMAVSSVHLMPVSLNIVDEPLGYRPPVGPPVKLTLRYSQRETAQPENANFSVFGQKWTCDWFSCIRDDPSNPLSDVQLFVRGGGIRTFTGFTTNNQSFAYQQYDQTLLTRTGTNSYELLSPDGSKLIFSHRAGIGASRPVLLSQIVDVSGNALTLTYDATNYLVAVTDAIGQVTTLNYVYGTNGTLVTTVTDPFGRVATLESTTNFITVNSEHHLGKITDVIGLTSRFAYTTAFTDPPFSEPYESDFIDSLITPYGTNRFSGGTHSGTTTRYLETTYPDSSRDRVEFNQNISNAPASTVPTGMRTRNEFLTYRNTYYWSRGAYAMAYPDYSKAKLYHWLHTADLASAAGILESSKEPLEERVWRDYAGQTDPVVVGTYNRPTHVGRVLDDGSTQVNTYAYDGFGHVTNSIDAVGRTFSYSYATNGIDLCEFRQTRGTNNELLARMTYNAQHLPLTKTDAAGQTTTNTYNPRGQLLITTNPRAEMTSFSYDTNGYLLAVDGPLPGTNDVIAFTYDFFGRIRTQMDVSGYTLTFDYDELDRVTKITHPDNTFEQITYDRLDPVVIRDRAGRQTLFEYDNMRQLAKRTDPLNRDTRFQWCSCGNLGSVTDPMGHTTSWNRDVQGRLTSKQYGDGSQVSYAYENATSRLRQRVDEKQQVTQYSYNRDNTLNSIAYANAGVSTPGVLFAYDPNYKRRISMTDGIGVTAYGYHPAGSLGALRAAAVDGPWANDTVNYLYDELGHTTNRAINGIAQTWSRDAVGRVTNSVNALGSFSYAYDASSRRLSDVVLPSGQSSHFEYFGNMGDERLQRISHRKADTSLISRFTYGHDVIGNITNWVQELGSLNETWTAGYDPANRLTSVLADQGGTNLVTTSYSYDAADNRVGEEIGGIQRDSHYNALNELVSVPSANLTNATCEWDSQHRLTAIVRGTNRIEFAYDGRGRLCKLSEKNGVSIAGERHFVWCGTQLCEERDGNNTVVSRYFKAGEQRGGTNLYYFSDHLGSVRELMDGVSVVRAEYAYTAFGEKHRLQGDLESNFGFTRLLNHESSSTLFAVHRVYDPKSARWLSRDPIGESGGMNLYAYVNQDPINRIDPLGYHDENGGGEDLLNVYLEHSGHALGNIAFGLDAVHQAFHGSAIMHGVLGDALPPAAVVIDAGEAAIDLYLAVDDPDAEHILKATYSTDLVLLAIAAPEAYLFLKSKAIFEIDFRRIYCEAYNRNSFGNFVNGAVEGAIQSAY